MIGGGNTAVEEALYLANIANMSRWFIGATFRAERIMVDHLMEKVKRRKITLQLNSTLDEVLGDASGVTGMRIKHVQSGARQDIILKGVFIAIGHKPNTDIFAGQLEMDNGYILTRGGSSRQCHGDQHLRRIRGRRCAGSNLPRPAPARRPAAWLLSMRTGISPSWAK